MPEHTLNLFDSFEDSLWLRGRTRDVANADQPRDGDFVLYWMHNAVRAHENPALDVALLAAKQLGKPLLVYHAISERYPYASDRLHTFMLEGARDVQREFATRGVPYVFHLEREEHRGAHLRTLADRAAIVITEDVPVSPIVEWLERLAEGTATPIQAVDASCVVPMQLVGKAHTRAFAYRDATSQLYDERLGLEPKDVPHDGDGLVPNDLPFEPLDLQAADTAKLIADCKIDHAVGPVPHTRGGSTAGYARWDQFKESGLRGYAKRRNNALIDGVSRMSAYLHFGMVSPFRIAREAMQFGGKGAEKYLDELLIWRELAWAFCFYQRDHESLSAIPNWAVETLADHEGDERPALFDWETLARGMTGDAIWDAAQKSLLMHGELHNNVRMTWGKAFLNWTPDAKSTLARMIDLNHRYALDGRDPASYGGLLWCLGQFDRPFKPPKDVIGTVRPRPTRDHARRLDPDDYLTKTTRPLLPSMPTIAVIGAGMSGLVAARILVDHGFDVTVFDKGRGVGGRMSSRRTDTGLRFDHGAQYFTAKDERFRRYVDAWHDFGIVETWNRKIVELDGETITDRDSSNRFVGVPGMNAICKHLARDVKVVGKTKIDGLERTDRWQLSAAGESAGSFDFVVVAIPPTQAAELLGSSTPLAQEIAATSVAPCWAGMFAFSERIDLPADGVFVKNSVISWMARDSSKPSREMAEDCWVVHASADWSAENIELEPDEVRDLLLSEFYKVTNTKHHQPLHAVAHRWRFANPESHLESGFLLDESNQLVVCGDWCLGNRVEAAFLSGTSAAGAMLRHVLQAEHTNRVAGVDG